MLFQYPKDAPDESPWIDDSVKYNKIIIII